MSVAIKVFSELAYTDLFTFSSVGFLKVKMQEMYT